MDNKGPFSKRFAHQRATPLRVRDDAPSELRTFVGELVRHFCPYAGLADELVSIASGTVPEPLSNMSDVLIWSRTTYNLRSMPWYRVYDVIERLHSRMVGPPHSDDAPDMRDLVNTFFEENGYAFKLSPTGSIEYRGEESFAVAIATADVVLQAAGFVTAKTEIHKALEDLVKRPNPDLTGAIQHAIAGLECAAKSFTSEPKLELGKIVKRHPDVFPPPLGEVVAQLYGYASNNGRHLTEGEEPEFPEAELIVGIAATAATYLGRKKR